MDYGYYLITLNAKLLIITLHITIAIHINSATLTFMSILVTIEASCLVSEEEIFENVQSILFVIKQSFGVETLCIVTFDHAFVIFASQGLIYENFIFHHNISTHFRNIPMLKLWGYKPPRLVFL